MSAFDSSSFLPSIRILHQGRNAANAARDVCAIYGEGAVSVRTVQRWISRFKNGNFDLKDAARSGRPIELDEDRLDQLIHENPWRTTRELAHLMDTTATTISRNGRSTGKVQKLGAWVLTG